MYMLLILSVTATMSVNTDTPSTVVPAVVHAPHDTDVLSRIVREGAEASVYPGKGGDVLEFEFPSGSFLDGVSITLEPEDKPQPRLVNAFVHSPSSAVADASVVLEIKSDGRPHAFDIEKDIGFVRVAVVDRFRLKLLAPVNLTELTFSRLGHGTGGTKPEYLCPLRDLGPRIAAAYDAYLKNPEDSGRAHEFVKLMTEGMQKYDCPCELGKQAAYPAIWLWGDLDIAKWYEVLAGMKDEEAQKLFASDLFRSTLDGGIAEEYWDKSLAVEKDLISKGVLPAASVPINATENVDVIAKPEPAQTTSEEQGKTYNLSKSWGIWALHIFFLQF